LGRAQQGLKELGAGQSASHKRVSAWLRSWGKPGEGKAPAMRTVWSRRRRSGTWWKSEATWPRTIRGPGGRLPRAYWKAWIGSPVSAHRTFGPRHRDPELVVFGTPYVIPYRVTEDRCN